MAVQMPTLADVREVPESGLVGHEGHGSSVFLPVRGLGQVDLLKLQRVLGLQHQRYMYM